MTYGIDIHGQELTEAEVNTLKASGKRFDVKDGQRVQFTAVEETARDEKDKVVLASIPLAKWTSDMAKFKLSRETEDLITAGSLTMNAYQKTIYDAKVARRAEKP
jgi:hypothetical protein